ncbi:nucleotidyltransferase [Halobacillus sp. Marseille-Q1614]|uniref:nucleotidyltransferase n=1 Tax=Halobacillus sp. Marseille-Q1614 TaxID=2709134 RepID=UPI00156D5A9E|nr:nucleotidyltransferase [Halobacillus sp. Marseille-Q1614]
MKACGIIVEYNPFHNGHRYHIEESQKLSNADCIIAVMSGQFLQRGEPAIIDKWHRAKAALQSGVDLVIELPYLYAVQHSDYFSKGAVELLGAAGVDSICFGSEQGTIHPFISAYQQLHKHSKTYQSELKKALSEGLSFPNAARKAQKAIGLTEEAIDFSSPNNILGYSYVKQMLTNFPEIEPLTIKRKESQYHQEEISGRMASATSLRKQLFEAGEINNAVSSATPESTKKQLSHYYDQSGLWHNWELYFTLLYYKLSTLTYDQLNQFHGVDEGIEYRLKEFAASSLTFKEFMERIKTKRYTWTRLQRTCAHILTGLLKEEADSLLEQPLPYIRVLGMSKTGQTYLSRKKKHFDRPLFTQPQQLGHNRLLEIEKRATAAYYSPLAPDKRTLLSTQEYGPPVRVMK